VHHVELLTTELSSIKKRRHYNEDYPYSSDSEEREAQQEAKRQKVIDYLLKEMKDERKKKSRHRSREGNRNRTNSASKNY